MGFSSYDITANATLTDRNLLRSRGLAPAFAYNADIKQGKTVAKVHEKMDPKGATRESRDSAAHPASVPVAVFFDVTGSMGKIPVTFQKRLPHLMTLLTEQGYITDPQVLFGAITDARSNNAPLQVGQFESGLEMDDDLERVWLEGGGGSNEVESYELAHYFVARHVRTDAWEKRQRKGYLFTMGDEGFYTTIEPRRVAEVIGDGLAEAVTTRAIIDELKDKWHVFHLHVQEGSYRNHPVILNQWRQLLGEDHVVLLENASNVAEVIGLIVGLVEGTVDLAAARGHLGQLGLDSASAEALIAGLGRVAARGIRLRADAAVTA